MFKSAPRLLVSRLFPLSLLPLSFLLLSCGTQPSSSPLVVPASRHGLVHGGQQPVVGATIQLYAVGTAGDGSVSTPLLSPAAVSDANGGFNISGAYTCPSPSALVYIVATGGNPGLAPGTDNSAIAMMAALGPCGSLSSSTFIFLNELTTVAAVYALAPFISSPSAIGSAPGDAASLASAFTLASQLANTGTGSAPGVNLPAGTTVPVAQINTIADIVSTCINSTGGVSGDTTPCGMLFSLTTPPGMAAATDTISALLHLADDPTLNTASLYNLVTPSAPFQPSQAQTPPDLSVRLTVPSGFTASSAVLNFPPARIGTLSAPPPETVTFTNNTAAPVAIDIASFIFVNPTASGADPYDFRPAGFSAGLEDCPTPVLPGASCSLHIVFSPLGVGPRSAYLTVNNTSENPVIWILLTGEGLEANAGPAALSTSIMRFTAPNVPMTATLINSGTLPLSIDGVSISGDPTSGQPAFTQTNDCGSSLQPQSTCTITVTALSTTQPYSTGVLKVGDDAASGPQTATLSYSNGFSGPVLFDFGSRSLTTQGTGPLQFVPPGIPSGPDTLSLTGPNATDFSFAPGSSSQSSSCLVSRLNPFCSPTIYFTPSALGLRTATLMINGTPYAGFIGVGLPAGLHFSLSPTAIDLGLLTVGQTSPASTVAILNTGTVPISFNPPALSGANPSEFAVTSTCATLPPNGTCSLSVTSTPAQPTNRFATLTLSETTGTVQQAVSLRALGSNPGPVANPNTLNFPYTPLGSTSASQSFMVTSFNNDPVSVQVMDSALSPFILTQGNSCSMTPCQISVAFAPTAANTAPLGSGNAFSEVVVTDLSSGQAAVISVSGILQPPPPPPPPTTLSLSPTSLTFDPQAVGTTSTTGQQVAITNSGTQPLVVSQISLTGQDPADYNLIGSCPISVPVQQTCIVTIAFSPTATGVRAANLQILSNATSSPDVISITGTGQ